MVMPKIEREAEARNYGKFIISPLERGYGVTVGNALRRVLLSSLDGAAVTSIRILDVLHEFSDIPGVREDVIQVTLQVKQLRMKLDGVDSARMHLEVRGEGTVTAADIIAPPEIEIVNPDLFLFTVDSPKAKLDIEFMVERGRGYSPANERSGHTPIGELPVDAIFSPVKRVNWEVGSARVGQSTNYDKLTLEIWTDGAISPERALSAASRALIDQLRFIAGISEETLTIPLEKEVAGGRITSEVAETPVEALDLSVRVFNSLKRTGITNVGDVLDLLEKGEQAVMSIRNFGEKSLDELRQKMREKGYLKDDTTSAE
ncbi:MAG: DNA-directed RNA polymerase subunit alpha [Anaerolineae bacterium]|jgi:DNA-directed RNA polymerase subunit alpha|nr:DNA-directed RNA polymerase subunit alpha [Anaerolineales bacterium]MCC7512509.1 DNA-directed RNA polymerase subunit alpha [Anaerolineae bacterium]NOG76095.1 DNA-directed RNA polymerase subunit alpha [Chloroflexota bacterium]OQY86438.1 MAG: DNA-directed RNA polymerase subunit alpha [Anaerolineae bacterium UTCFX3]